MTLTDQELVVMTETLVWWMDFHEQYAQCPSYHERKALLKRVKEQITKNKKIAKAKGL